eukprot:scaffold93601_cov32-Tisochrysis_lutea.AAC.8
MSGRSIQRFLGICGTLTLPSFAVSCATCATVILSNGMLCLRAFLSARWYCIPLGPFRLKKNRLKIRGYRLDPPKPKTKERRG